jgi:enoyl-CoA hydratase/long-chain 3-hydroxyacyl-CoA dehydrogenase
MSVISRRWIVARLARMRAHGTMQMRVSEEGVAVIRMDCVGEKQNTLSTEMFDEFESMLTQVETLPEIKAAVLISGKKDSWVAGANIKMLQGLKTADAATETAGIGQKGFDRIEAMQAKKPWVAAIDGSCLGGGLELALTCAHRVATSSPKTVLGLPEVMLGLLPGCGGTQRLPKLVGAPAALDMLLTGKNIKPAKAKKMGLVDLVVDPNALERAAIATAIDASSGTLKPNTRKLGWVDWFLEKTPPGRSIMFSKAKQTVDKQTKGKYPAPHAILKCTRVGIEQGHVAGSRTERELFGELSVTKESQSLRGLFFGQTESKKNRFAEASLPISTAAVLGAGLMGAGIAEVSASKGFRVLLKDRDMKGLTRGEDQISKNLGTKLKRKRMTKFQHDSALASVVGLTDAHASWKRHFGQADLVIEAVFEEMGVKHAVIKEMEAVVPSHCILASNTSTLPIGEIASAAARPENVVGMHYFSPVDKMPLLEVIPHAGTSPAVSGAAVDFGIKQGKTVIAVKDVPGFYVNRCLGPFLVEALGCVQEGFDPLKLNQASLDFGYPVGGITLVDEVGIDVANHVVNNLIGEQPKYLGNRMDGGDVNMLDAFVEAGLLGRKSGGGFFDYTGKEKVKKIHPEATRICAQFRHPTKDSSNATSEEVIERCVMRFVVEAVYCLQDGIIHSARDGDIGAVFGVGFPPFLGGPFMYIDALGADNVVARLKELQAKHGDHFAPPALLKEHAASGQPFHSV